MLIISSSPRPQHVSHNAVESRLSMNASSVWGSSRPPRPSRWWNPPLPLCQSRSPQRRAMFLPVTLTAVSPLKHVCSAVHLPCLVQPLLSGSDIYKHPTARTSPHYILTNLVLKMGTLTLDSMTFRR
ncbi:hypothetical protein NA56DRAFT_701549 [Hyaloscypha hepaticicola]|uniref:Uncharacterized protein n=1 Tax=Hyaloscypha hepaticicola TaxID=2082293 RepID=A0A2J6QAH2_9HELO|nr:hypothetical protein NA56DRAFT_701549 [Hyaloscypha hepaticicola]